MRQHDLHPFFPMAEYAHETKGYAGSLKCVMSRITEDLMYAEEHGKVRIGSPTFASDRHAFVGANDR